LSAFFASLMLFYFSSRILIGNYTFMLHIVRSGPVQFSPLFIYHLSSILNGPQRLHRPLKKSPKYLRWYAALWCLPSNQNNLLIVG